MLKLVKLNLEIEKLLQFDIEYNVVIQNFLYNQNWVTEISSRYFDNTKEKIEKLIDENIDYKDEANILFIEDLLKDVKIFSMSLNERLKNYSSYKFSLEDWSSSLVYPKSPPKISPLDLPEPSPQNDFDDRNEYIIEIIKGFFDIDSSFDANRGTEIEEETIDDILMNKHNIESTELQLIYGKAHLTYILALHENMVNEIGNFLNSIIKVYNRRKSKVEENLISFIAEDLKLEFNLSKINLGHLFYNLYEIEIIAKDTKDVRDERTSLKNYINQANMYYLDGSTFVKAQKMTRAMPVARETDSKEVRKEIIFLEDLVLRLNNRIESLEEIYKNLKKKKY